VQDEFDDALAPRGLLVGPQEQQIDVGKRRQLAAAIAADGDDRQPLGLRGVLRVVEMLGGEIVEHLDQRVLDVRQRTRRRQPLDRAAFGLQLHGAARVGERRFDVSERVLAQLRLIRRGMRQRGEIAPQRVAVEECRMIYGFEAQCRSFVLRCILKQLTRRPTSDSRLHIRQYSFVQKSRVSLTA